MINCKDRKARKQNYFLRPLRSLRLRSETRRAGRPAPPALSRPDLLATGYYQINRAPIRAVRGARIAVGRWKFGPVVVVMVSAAY